MKAILVLLAYIVVTAVLAALVDGLTGVKVVGSLAARILHDVVWLVIGGGWVVLLLTLSERYIR